MKVNEVIRKPKRKRPQKAPPRAVRRLFFGEDVETRDDKSFPAFPSSRFRIQTSNLVFKDVGYMDEAQRSRLVAVGTLSGKSSITFESFDWSGFDEPLGNDALLHVFQGEKPGIYGERIVDSKGGGSWRFYASFTAEQFHYLHRHVTGVDPLTGEKMHTRPSSDVIELGGTNFEPLDPDNPASLDFKAELQSIKLGGWPLLGEQQT